MSEATSLVLGTSPHKLLTVDQTPAMPATPRPIVSIGAGDIVRHAHYPAYKIAGFEVATVFDLNRERAQQVAEEFGVPRVAETLSEAVEMADSDAVFDVALPPRAYASVLEQLPDGASVLIQKPFGERLAEAEELVAICHRKRLNAAVNFQLRTAPYVLAAKRVIASGEIGAVHEVDFKINVHTPWNRWTFLEPAPSMELIYHSIHYIDLVRDLLGEPDQVCGLLSKHPATPNYESSRTAAVFGYGPDKRAMVVTHHGHDWGELHEESSLRIEGIDGAIVIQMGLNRNYPDGASDWMHVYRRQVGEWESVPLTGSWFPHAFIGSMASVMIAAETQSPAPTNVDDALKTMQLLARI